MDNDASKAFKQLKEFLTKPHVLTVPDDGETLLLYIAATTHVVSTALVIEQDEPGPVYKVQRPVYIVSWQSTWLVQSVLSSSPELPLRDPHCYEGIRN